MGFVQEIQGEFNIKKKSTNVIHHTNRTKMKRQISVSIDAKQAFNKDHVSS